MQSRTSTAAELDTLIRELSPNCNAVEVVFPGEDFDRLVKRLATIRKLALIDERELGALLLAEAARHGRPIIDELAGEQFEGLTRDADDKIVRPDFGGKRS